MTKNKESITSKHTSKNMTHIPRIGRENQYAGSTNNGEAMLTDSRSMGEQ